MGTGIPRQTFRAKCCAQSAAPKARAVGRIGPDAVERLKIHCALLLNNEALRRAGHDQRKTTI